ncbi:MAG: uracil-DNA glycosylase [Nitrospirae bacterium]|nr:uracil-DNA glycosylase [Nitrospirota bacterium]
MNQETVNNIKNYLIYLKETGVNELPVELNAISTPSPFPSPLRGEGGRGKKLAGQASYLSEKEAPETLEDVRRMIGDCKRCGLYKKRKNIVFGSGNEKAEIVFVGEAPGGDEDIQGKPFVGAAGQLLTKIIEAMGLKREDVYIANIIKCRPPNNRNPLEDEIEACEPFLKEQLRIINPKIICALGTFAAQTLLKTKEKITSIRGKFYTYEGIKLMPTFHPAYLLRNPNDKKLAWEDVQKIMAEYSLSI